MAFVASMMPRLEYSLVDVMVLYSLNLDCLKETYKLQPRLANATLAPYGHVLQLWTDRRGKLCKPVSDLFSRDTLSRPLTLSSGLLELEGAPVGISSRHMS